MPDAVQTTNTIHRELNAAGWFNWGLHGHVLSAANALRDPNLTPAEANKAVDTLSANGDLNKFARETLASGLVGGGLSTSERQHFMADIAGKLGGKQLAELSNAFASTDRNSGGHDYVQELGHAVATHASPQAKLDYIRALAPLTTDKPSYNEIFIGGSMIVEGDAEASAVGDVLGSLSAQRAHDGFAALSADQRTAVLKASVGSTVNYLSTGNYAGSGAMGTSSSTTLMYDTSHFDNLMRAAASTNDTALKTDLFNASAGLLRGVRDAGGVFSGVVVDHQDSNQATIAKGMTRLLDSDTTGVVRTLAYGAKTFDGSAMATYAKQMLQSGQEAKLGEFMAKLSKGNDVSGNPIERFEHTIASPSGRSRAENAGAMGSFVGSVYKATESISGDVKAQQTMVTAVLKSALTVFDKSKTWGNPGGLAASVAKEWVSYAVNAAIQDPGNSAATQLERAALPIDPKTNTIAVGDAASGAFGEKIEQARRLAKP